ncbi:TonB-dependent receptor plug domain-containing protein [Phenylobacterium sp. LjRoot219]|uniref:TonB-dependent receptor n=1 Tax=Phenylobacterium sp. LjRoot219 TaxID=3342283 RepID=UPI003ED0C76D
MRGSTTDRQRRDVGLTASILLASTILSTPGFAWAQAQGQGAQQAAPTVTQELIVTARRRSENISRVPTAITAFSGEELAERAIRTDSDLQLITPGFTVRQTQGNNNLTYSIRGQTADTFSGSPSAVVAYLNEVPLTVSAASSLFDMESIQVLKGPQGTLFGRNATGGAVLYSSAKPTNDLEASFRMRVGNLELREVEGAINVPIVEDKVLFRGAFNVIERAGYIHDLFNGDEKGIIDRQSGRVSLTLQPTERLTNTSMFQYSHAGGTNTGASYVYNVYPCGATNNGATLNCAAAALFTPQTVNATFGPGSWDRYLAAHPGAYAPGILDYLEEQKRLGPYKTNYVGGSKHQGNDWFLSNVTNFEANDNLTVRNIFGLSRSWYRSEQGGVGAPFGVFLSRNLATGENGNRQLANSVSEELQLQGQSFDNHLTWIIGGYFQDLTVDTSWPQVYFDVSPLLAPTNVTSAYRTQNRTQALYAQGTYDLGDLTSVEGLRFTAGLRYTWERVKFRHIAGSSYFGAPEQSRKFSDPSWEVGLEYQATPEVLTYIKTRGSFRSGGFNGAAPPVNTDAAGGGNRFDSEHTQDIEGGVKFRGEVAGRPATLNVAAFYQWIQDIQRVEFPAVPGGSIAVTVNVPKAKVYGLEIDSSILATSWLELGASGSFVKAKFTDPDVELFGTAFSYGPFPDTPEASGVVYAQATLHDSEDLGQFTLRGEAYAQTHVYFSSSAASLTPGTKLPGYTLLNARLGWDNIGGTNLSAALWGKNLTDKTYFTGGIPLGASLGTNNAAVGEPRTYGLELSAKF